MRLRFVHQEEGASLVIVLIVMSVFGLILGGLLTATGASVRYTTTVDNYEKKLYAADAGVNFGIQQLQDDSTLCPATNSSGTVGPITVNGYDVSATCHVTAGNTVGGLGWAVITRSTGPNSLVTQSGSKPKVINGPVFIGGTFGNNPGVKVTNGKFWQGSPSEGCPPLDSDTGWPQGLSLDDGHRYDCGMSEPTVPVPVAPEMPSEARDPEPSGSCTYFYPGKYTATDLPRLSLISGTMNYFASGVYYFENAGQWLVDEVAFAGAPGGFEEVAFKDPVPSGESYTPRPDCANDTEAIAAAGGNAPEVTGTGAQFILGGDSRIFLGNGSQLEVFARTLDGTSDNATASVVAVPDSGWTGWLESTDFGLCTGNQNNSMCAYDFHQGSGPNSVIHGLVYLPEQNARLWSTNSVRAAVLGGILAWELELQSSNSGSGLQVSAGDGKPEPREIVITATAPASAGTERQITSTAVVGVANDDQKTVTIRSWRTRGITEAL